MTKTQLRFLAVLLSGLIVLVLFAGLDDLPRKVRAEIATEQKNLATSERELIAARDEVKRDLSADPDLFRVHSMSTAFPERLARAEVNLNAARRDMDSLAVLNKANRRNDREKAEQLLRLERGRRMAAVSDAQAVQREARAWIERKQHLPEQLAQMERDYQAARAADLGAIASVVARAESDWPEKKVDLESRLAALRAQPAEAEKIWESTAEARRKIAARDLASFDYATFFTSAESLHDAANVPTKAGELRSLTGQLYDSWDKLLVDLDVRRSGSARQYREKLRTVRTHFTDVAAKKTEVTTDEKWVEVSKPQFDSVEDKLGMAIEHKSAGKYESEVDRVAQPAGFAYIAPPTQGSNQYGYWQHSGGNSMWVWLPQYLLMRDLLYNRDYRPLGTGEYEGYRTAQRSGQTYYGRDETSNLPKYGSGGTLTQRRYADSNYARSGGYKDSRYATGGGGYRGSQYESPAARSGQGQGDSGGRKFGRSTEAKPDTSRRSWEAPDTWNRHSASPSSRPIPRSSPGGGGRRFGSGSRRR
jgi:hypothetical protein